MRSPCMRTQSSTVRYSQLCTHMRAQSKHPQSATPSAHLCELIHLRLHLLLSTRRGSRILLILSALQRSLRSLNTVHQHKG